MPSKIYEVVAQGARYWFLFLMALIVWRSYRWYRRDRKQRKKRLRLLPDAGHVGELVVLRGDEDMPRGTVLPVPCEGTLGFLRTNDLCVTVRGVGKKHLWFCFDEGDGLMIEPFRRCTLSVDGEKFENRRNPLYMKHGSRLIVGEAELRLRLFAGFEVVASVRRREDIGEDTNEKGTNGAAAMTPEMMQQMWMQQYIQQQAYQQWLLAQQVVMDHDDGAGNAACSGNNVDNTYGEDMDELVAPPVEAMEGMFAIPMKYVASMAKEEKNAFAPIVPAEEICLSAGAAAMQDDAPADAPPNDALSNGYASLAPSQTIFTPDTNFFPVTDDEPVNAAWPCAIFPQSDAVFESRGYTYPEYAEREDFDEDMTDAAAPPKSAYIGHDEAENAKKKLWDKYLGGGQKR